MNPPDGVTEAVWTLASTSGVDYIGRGPGGWGPFLAAGTRMGDAALASLRAMQQRAAPVNSLAPRHGALATDDSEMGYIHILGAVRAGFGPVGG